MIFFCLSIIIVILIFFFDVFRKKIYSYKDIIISFFIGVLFSIGLMESGIAQRHSVLEFLSIFQKFCSNTNMRSWSYSGLNLLTFNLKMEKPLFNKKFQLPDKTEIDRKLIFGAAILGIGWGFGGICPRPGFLCFLFYLPQSIVFMIIFFVDITRI